MVITVLCVIMVILAVFLVIAVLMQSGKEPGLSGTIAGGAETFFGKNKGKTIDKALNTATMIVSIIFVAIVLFVYILQSAETRNQVNPAADSTQTEVVTGEQQKEEPGTTESAVVDDTEKATEPTVSEKTTQDADVETAKPEEGQTDATQQSADAGATTAPATDGQNG